MNCLRKYCNIFVSSYSKKHHLVVVEGGGVLGWGPSFLCFFRVRLCCFCPYLCFSFLLFLKILLASSFRTKWHPVRPSISPNNKQRRRPNIRLTIAWFRITEFTFPSTDKGAFLNKESKEQGKRQVQVCRFHLEMLNYPFNQKKTHTSTGFRLKIENFRTKKNIAS